MRVDLSEETHRAVGGAQRPQRGPRACTVYTGSVTAQAHLATLAESILEG